MLAFTFPEPADEVGQSLDGLTRLPKVPVDNSVVYSLRISLDGSKPRVWRRIHLKDTNLELLHHVIQVVMGWEDSHLHGFTVRKIPVPLVEDGAAIDERSISISQLFAAKIKTFHYTYDFGDDWRHTAEIESVFAAPPEFAHFHCVAGKGTCPIEDIGGMWHWVMLLEALQQPDVEHDEGIDMLLDRVGEDYTPAPFDLVKTNAKLQRIFNKRLRRKGDA